MTESGINRTVFLLAITVLSVLMLSVIFAPGFGNFDNKISKYHTENALIDAAAPNVVSTIVWDYRAYDTLGEETVLFTSTLGIYALFRSHRKYGKKFSRKVARK